ncbi:ECF-type sigma factor [Tahibacter soli]|jgi:RNA polymerase sigma factor (TIGR02999 family)|uniref:ECF-type sigma factor n=1 Tax=Tahibacter soli TaxID=2983605 RepID=A0A9X4BKZ9_9GAMM|nr:ECF-type sigma factor [Tahibacter soli]MDC8016243.1 ECF-type sigma factor [Tahibacter soli]
MSPTKATPATHSIDPVFEDLYARLKAMASRQRARGANATLCTTELVHETYLRLGDARFAFDNAERFFSYAARAMRSILADAARRRGQHKRGGDLARIDLGDPLVGAVHVDPALALQLDDALTSLEREDPRAARLVELHYFAGRDLYEVADLLGIARRTADRDWRFARAFLASRASG